MAESKKERDEERIQAERHVGGSHTVTAPPIGSIVLVRTSINTFAPAIVTNDYAGQNTAGAISLVVFNSAPFDNQVVRAVPTAQAETKDIDPDDIVREPFLWWQPVGSELYKRDLQKEIDAKRPKPKEEKVGAA